MFLIVVLQGAGYHLLLDFSRRLKIKNKSDLSHLGDLSDILQGHFDEK